MLSDLVDYLDVDELACLFTGRRELHTKGKIASKVTLLGALALTAISAAANAAVYEVNSFLVGPPVAGDNNWYASDVRPGGTASVVDLTGAGGNLENNQPLPNGAALLTTDLTNAAKAEVFTYGNFGNASSVFNNNSLALGYEYFKQAVAGGNAAAAPSLKLNITAPNHSSANDGFGTLVYEPYWNLGLANPTPGDWQNVSITAASGLWWWTGGFDQPNTAGGPPLRTLADWAALFGLDPDFASAVITGIGMGVGTFNAGQVGYFDEVRFSVDGGVNAVYDFEAPGVVPEPMTVVVWSGLGICGSVIAWRAKRRQAAT